jgi:hypothetical protein
MERLITRLDELPYGPAAALLLVESVVIFALALLGGALLVRLLRARARGRAAAAARAQGDRVRVDHGAPQHQGDAGGALALPARHRALSQRPRAARHPRRRGAAPGDGRGHRIVHVEPFYRWFHALHHRYDRPRPLTLFVLSPQEVLAFGALWLAVIWIYPPSWLGMSIYLALNVIFGTVEHLGVELVAGEGVVAGSWFHARHHADRRCNFGFYTTLWDRLFKSLGRRRPG